MIFRILAIIALAAVYSWAGYGVIPNAEQYDTTGSALMHAWDFNDSASALTPDSIGSKPGKMLSGAYLNTLYGRVGKGLVLDGVDNYDSLGFLTNFNSTTAFSIELWFKPSVVVQAHDGYIVRLYVDASTYWLLYISSDGKLWWVNNNSANSQGQIAASNLTAGQWNHIVFAWAANAAPDAYINGVKYALTETSGTFAAAMYFGNYPVDLGGAGGFSVSLNGALDGVKMYKSKLDSSYVVSAYNYYTSTVTVTDFGDHQIIQRCKTNGNPGGTSASVTVSGTYTGTPDTIFAAVKYFDGDTVVDWTAIDTDLSGGTFSGSLTVPQGGMYKILAKTNWGNHSVGVNKWGVGDVWALAGQSNVSGGGTLAGTARDTARDSCGMYVPGAWSRLRDPSRAGNDKASFAPRFANTLLDSFGVPIGIVNCGIGGTALYDPDDTLETPIRLWQYRYPSDHYDTTAGSYGKSVKYIQLAGGKVRGLVWFQGENDAGRGVSKANYKMAFDSIAKWWREDITNADSIPLVIVQIPRTKTPPESLRAIQEAHYELENLSNMRVLGAVTWDLPMESDSAHLTFAGLDTLGLRLGKRIKKYFDGNIAAYPKFSSVTIRKGSNRLTLTANRPLTNITDAALFTVRSGSNTLTVDSTGASDSSFYVYTNSTINGSTASARYAYGSFPAVVYAKTVKDELGQTLPQVFDWLTITLPADDRQGAYVKQPFAKGVSKGKIFAVGPYKNSGMPWD